jgi:5-methylcytosine-specific restriction endonuclease McrA
MPDRYTNNYCSRNCREQGYYADNKEKIYKYKREYHQKNRDKHLNYLKNWRENNKDKIRELNKRYRENNKEHLTNWNKNYYNNNKDQIKTKTKMYKINVSFPRLLKKYKENGFNFKSAKEMEHARWEWSQVVRYRDNYICQRCGSVEDVKAHHIIPYVQDISQSLDVDNGITLCSNCHDRGNKGSIHNIFWVNYNIEEFWDWFGSYDPEITVERDYQESLDSFVG